MRRLKPGLCVAFICIASISAASLSAQVTITQQPEGVTVQTPVDTLRLTVCGPTSVHIVASPDGTAQGATSKQPWLIKQCTPAKFTFTPAPELKQSDDEKLRNSASATVDTGAFKILISPAWGNLEFQDEQGHRLLQEFQDAPRRYVKTTINGE